MSMKRFVVVCVLGLLVTVLVAPGLPWSARLHLTAKRLLTKAKTRIAVLRGQHPTTVTVTGRLVGRGAQIDALKGARVFIAESTSGYSALTDSESRFQLPHLIWYPGASYNLIVEADAYHAKRLEFTAPSTRPYQGVMDVGALQFDNGYVVRLEESVVREMKYDSDNDGYYKDLFSKVTANSATDHQAISAINRYVAGKLNYQETALTFKSPRQILERGSCYCSNLALAMAAITAAGEYPTQTIHLSDSPEHQHTHVVVEVFYDDQWHVYDPTYGIVFHDRDGDVASYKELRLNPDLVTSMAFAGFKPETAQGILAWMPKTYQSGFHQIHRVSKRAVCSD
jgi:hypothetical protein